MELNEELKELKSFSREHLHAIWQSYKAGEMLEGEDKVTAELMDLHPEYYDDWNSTNFDREFDPENDVNPFLHITFDIIIMNQINANDPPQAKFTYNKLVARGYNHIEVIHRMGSILLEEYWGVMNLGKSFNVKSYSRKLKNLK